MRKSDRDLLMVARMTRNFNSFDVPEGRRVGIRTFECHAGVCWENINGT